MGAKTIVRPASVASDTATADDVVGHFLREVASTVRDEDLYIVYLQPTSPLRTFVHIDDAFKLMESREENIAVSVVKLRKTPYKSFTMDKYGLLRPIFSEKMSNSNRQDLPAAYYPNGAIYIFLKSEFLKRGRFPCDGGVPYMMNERDSLDIDLEEDFVILETIMENSDG
jgi:CMP-N-acetylneuraminic acid synthetase